jgi:hypothetical protein
MTITYHSGGRLQGIETDRLGDIIIQGYNGGVGSTARGGGGGGGSGAVGGNGQGDFNPAGDGGIGLQNDITGTNTYYAGGGGGGRDFDANANSRVGYGGTGGGGNGQVAGTDYLGGGGGGGSGDGGSYVQAGVGGKGVVILQFTTSGTSYSQTGTYDTPDTSTVSGKTILRWTGSGTFVLSSGTPDVEYLVVAGGGGGYSSSVSKRGTGGGGAGGLLTGTKSSMVNGTYTVTIGNGGAVSNNGDDSVFSDVTTTGGGTGGNNSNSSDAQDGGSGGGSGEFTTTSTPLGETINLTGTPVIPTDVPDYSRFEETDTRKMYSYLPISKSGCLAYYNFEQTSGTLTNQATTSNGFTDGLGSAVDGTNNGATQTATGKIGNAWSFDGTNDYISISNNTSLPSGAEVFTYNIWVNLDTWTGYRTFFSLGTGVTNEALYVTNDGNSNDGNVEVHRYGGEVGDSSPTTIAIGTWNMITVTYTGTTVELFINGVSVDTTVHTLNVDENGMRIGKNSHNSEFMDGKLDEFSVWNRVLTTDEISLLYNSGTGATVDNALSWKEKGTT